MTLGMHRRLTNIQRRATSTSSSARTRSGAPGSANNTVPSATLVAPHATSSKTSRPLCTPPIPTIGNSVARRAAIHGGERDRLQRRSGVPAGAARERRSKVCVERDAAQRVDETDPVRARRLDSADALAEIPGMGGKLGVERDCGAASRQAATISAAPSGASSTFGQERLSSRQVDVVVRELARTSRRSRRR